MKMLGSKLIRPLAAMLTLALLLGQAPLVFAADLPDPLKPDLTAIVVATGDEKFVEIGFSLKSNEAKFKAAALVLKYDAKMLTPIDWEEVPGDVKIGQITAEMLTADARLAQDPWSIATNVNAMSSPNFSVREAKAFVDATAAVSPIGYLCLNAMMPRAIPVNLALPDEKEVDGKPGAYPGEVSLVPDTKRDTTNGLLGLTDATAQTQAVAQAVVARFRVNVKTPGETPEYYNLEDIRKSIDVVNDTKDDLLVADDPLTNVAKSSPAGVANGLWYLADDSTPEYLAMDTPLDPYILTVPKGVSINTGGGGSSGPTLAVSLASGAIAEPQKVAYEAFLKLCNEAATGTVVVMPNITPVRNGYQFDGWSDGTSVFRYRADNPETPDDVEKPDEITLKETSAILTAVWNAVPSGFVSITCYDWDDTVLGGITAPKGDVTKYLKDFTKSLTATTEQLAGGLYYESAALPFTNKRGYSFDMDTFGVWLDNASETLTHYGSNVQKVMVAKPTTAEEGVIDLTNAQGNLLLKVCYGANSELHTTGLAEQYYTAERLSVERVAGNVFIAKVKVKRENTVDGKLVGVPRMGVPAVRVKMISGALTIPVLAAMLNQDEYIIETVPSTAVEDFRFSVVDTYQDANWPNAAIQSAEAQNPKGGVTNNLVENNIWTGTGYTGTGFYFEGTVAMYNASVMPGGSKVAISKNLLDEFKLNYKMVVSTPNTDVFKARKCPDYIEKAFNELNGITAETPTKPSYQSLTYKQIQYAIAFAGDLLTTDIT